MLIDKSLYEIFKAKPKNTKLDKGLFKDGGILYVAEDNGWIVGMVGIKKHKGRTARLKKMYVEKSWRGTGLSQKLYDRVQSFAKRKGYNKIVLSTTPQMKAAISFYQKQGFSKYRVNKHRNQIFFYKNI